MPACLLACPQHRAQVGNDTGLLGTGTLIGCALCCFLKGTPKGTWEGAMMTHANEDKHVPTAHHQQYASGRSLQLILPYMVKVYL